MGAVRFFGERMKHFSVLPNFWTVLPAPVFGPLSPQDLLLLGICPAKFFHVGSGKKTDGDARAISIGAADGYQLGAALVSTPRALFPCKTSALTRHSRFAGSGEKALIDLLRIWVPDVGFCPQA